MGRATEQGLIPKTSACMALSLEQAPHWAIQAIHVSKHHACWERLQYVRAAWTSVSIKGGDVAHEQGD